MMLQVGRDRECPSHGNWTAPCGPQALGLGTQAAPGAPRCPRPVHAPPPGLRVGLGLCSKRAARSSPCFQTLRCPPAWWTFRSKLRRGWMPGEKLIIKRIQRRAPEPIGRLRPRGRGKTAGAGGPAKEVLPLRRGAFLSAQQEDTASVQGAVPERDVPQESGRAGGGRGEALSPSQKDPETGLGRRYTCTTVFTHLFKN